MRKPCLVTMVVGVALGATALGSAACATKKFVRSSVGATNDKVNTMIGALEETQARSRRHERRIAEIDAKTGAAAESASAARTVALGAASAANAAGSRLDAIDKANRKLVYDVALSADEGQFDFGRAELPADARIRIDALIHQLADEPQNVFIEIEGHTDNVGSNATNARVGLARARAVQRYLYDVHQIPLHKMNVISYGEERPAATNKTSEGRARNRRIVIRILG